ncbi:MAG: saccharopine dehydrogenase NADP-binding domain-containing protein [Solirubrobacterales bacterium]|nr:saccharopine dehydrogenase NADP-binding domain-containing protein [Solirubrobacterales bacterium]MBV9366807.1 saccharopine dehydrogenase NADP-binding domain-containing protein [Solirubrobacterales bacterium]MBV9683796.1 saccharopine dehydrogenase NADP-binding domain-containing protein [Solirubrobacterales bacterium]MBV9806491.1 saccharopine dehydrogenase NADP-binding domain-containing protein [Solirubrobacterales bacterium]
MTDRPYDIVVFGATGFTGALTAEYLAAHAPQATRWALAGRNQRKLEDVRRRLASVNAACAEAPLLRADVTDPDSVRNVAEATRVVITTVGPYIRYGEPLVAACASAGTDYVDLTGEPEFVDRMWLGYHEQAIETGARIVHSCGFDSIPYDLGALFTVQQLPEGVPISLNGFVRAGGTFSGGTYQSTIEILARLREAASVARERRRRETRPSDRRVKGVPGAPHHDEFGGGWAVPFPTIDPQTVLRSARALERYGPEFTYSHYLVVKRLPVLIGMVGGAAGVAALAQLPPTRKLLLEFKSSGSGPSPEEREKSSFRVRFVGRSGDRQVRTEVSGGDPGYGETSKMLAESALCLAHDDLPERAGQLTPAVAMGDALRRRLEAGGIRFEVLDGG